MPNRWLLVVFTKSQRTFLYRLMYNPHKKPSFKTLQSFLLPIQRFSATFQISPSKWKPFKSHLSQRFMIYAFIYHECLIRETETKREDWRRWGLDLGWATRCDERRANKVLGLRSILMVKGFNLGGERFCNL